MTFFYLAQHILKPKYVFNGEAQSQHWIIYIALSLQYSVEFCRDCVTGFEINSR